MNYTEKNMTTLATMQGISSALSELKIEGDELVYNGQRVNISKFDMSLLMGDQLPFESQLANLTPEDVYKIISLHAVTMESQTPTKQAASKNEAELEALKEKKILGYNKTIEDKELLLKDLCARLPYHPQIRIYNDSWEGCRIGEFRCFGIRFHLYMTCLKTYIITRYMPAQGKRLLSLLNRPMKSLNAHAEQDPLLFVLPKSAGDL